MQLLLLISSACLLLPSTLAYPMGVPIPECGHMYPFGHYADSQTSVPPYEIHVYPETYTPGSLVTVTMKLSTNSTIPYLGVFLQARVANCDKDHEHYDLAMGGYTLTKEQKKHFYLSRCNTQNEMGGCGDALSHKNGDPKTEDVVMTWQAPSQWVGDIYFRATFVQEQVIFWTNVFSKVVMQDATNRTRTKPQICPVFSKFSDFGYPLPTTPPTCTSPSPSSAASVRYGVVTLVMSVIVYVYSN